MLKNFSSLTAVLLLLTQLSSLACAQTSEHIDTLHQNAIVIDAHSDYLDRSTIDGAGLNEDTPGSQTTLSKLEQGQVDAQFFSVFVPPAYRKYGYANRTYELIDRLVQQVEKNESRIALAQTAGDIERLANEGKISALIGLEGGHSIENSLAHLRNYYRLGVRYMTLTWSNTNDWADSSGGDARWNGLNGFGEKVVKEMNRLGMMIDISHVSDDTFWDVIEHTTKPIIASHSLVRAEMDSKRNMSDEMIQAVAANGGVIQVSYYSQYVDKAFKNEFNKKIGQQDLAMNALGEKYLNDPIQLDIEQWSLQKKVEFTITPPSYKRVVDHIEHIIKLVGATHVGLGSDYDGMGAPPSGLEHVGKTKTTTAELVKRGYSDEDIKKILGGNLLRVMRANEVN